MQTMRVRTLEAVTHITAIHAYIAERNPLSAARVAVQIFAAAEPLGEFPHIGHAGLAPGTYEWPVEGCRISSRMRCTKRTMRRSCSLSSIERKIGSEAR